MQQMQSSFDGAYLHQRMQVSTTNIFRKKKISYTVLLRNILNSIKCDALAVVNFIYNLSFYYKAQFIRFLYCLKYQKLNLILSSFSLDSFIMKIWAEKIFFFSPFLYQAKEKNVNAKYKSACVLLTYSMVAKSHDTLRYCIMIHTSFIRVLHLFNMHSLIQFYWVHINIISKCRMLLILASMSDMYQHQTLIEDYETTTVLYHYKKREISLLNRCVRKVNFNLVLQKRLFYLYKQLVKCNCISFKYLFINKIAFGILKYPHKIYTGFSYYACKRYYTICSIYHYKIIIAAVKSSYLNNNIT